MPDYITFDEFKKTLTLTNAGNFADDDIKVAITSASEHVDDITHRSFGKDTDNTNVRYFTAIRSGQLFIDDIVELAEFATDPAGLGTYDYVWVRGQDYVLEPANAAAKGQPYTEVRALKGGRWGWGSWGNARYWLPVDRPQAIRATGQYGWPSVPAKVKEATSIIAHRGLRIKREAPLNVMTVGLEIGAAVHIAAQDPQVGKLLERLTRDQYFG